MKTLFANAPFAKFDLGTHAMGQATAFSVTDYLSKVGLDAADIDKINDPTFRAQYKEEYAACQAKGLDSIEGLTCIAALGAKVYAKLAEQEKAVPTTLVAPRPQTSEFPWVPVALGGAAAAGLIYFLATRGK